MLCFVVIFVGFLRISVIVGCLFKKQTLTAENYSITPNKKKKIKSSSVSHTFQS